MEFHPSAVTTVGSNIQLYCNASVVGLNNPRTHDSISLLIVNERNEQLNTSTSKDKTVEYTLDIKAVTHSDAGLYVCVARLSHGTQGCSRKDITLIVKGKFSSIAEK
jgi:hypothetical protein